MTNLAELTQRRPHRADARRNYDRLIATARDTFAEMGAEAPLEEIARRAGVGIATLYRNFPTREILVESVYIEEVEAVCEAAKAYAALEPWPALVAWLRRLVAYIGTKRALAENLNRDSETLKLCRASLYAAGEPVLKRAQAAGVVRPDVDIDDLTRLISGLTATCFTDDEQRHRLLTVAIDGLRIQD
jgi:AcrR family transcriptional regulator